MMFFWLLKSQQSMLRCYQLELGNKTSHIPKLLVTFQSKKNYACHYSILKFFCEQRLQATKLQETLSFNQSDVMKCYIQQNTKLRQQPVISTFEKDFFKLLNNSFFEMTMESLRSRYKMYLLKTTRKQNSNATSTSLRNSPIF